MIKGRQELEKNLLKTALPSGTNCEFVIFPLGTLSGPQVCKSRTAASRTILMRSTELQI